MHHVPDVFQSLLTKFRILYSDPTFQFKPPDSQFIGDTHLALFPHPTTNTLHQLLLAWRPDKEDYAQMPTFLISIRTLFRTLPEFFKNFTPLSILWIPYVPSCHRSSKLLLMSNVAPSSLTTTSSLVLSESKIKTHYHPYETHF